MLETLFLPHECTFILIFYVFTMVQDLTINIYEAVVQIQGTEGQEV